MISLVRFLSLEVFLSPSEPDGLKKLISIIRNHACDIEKYWIHVHLARTHEKVRSSSESGFSMKELTEAPKLEDIKSLLEYLEGILVRVYN